MPQDQASEKCVGQPGDHRRVFNKIVAQNGNVPLVILKVRQIDRYADLGIAVERPQTIPKTLDTQAASTV